jgi:hypothetical protein
VLGLGNTDPFMSGAVTVSGSAIVTLTDCTASTNSGGASSFYVAGSGQMTADCATTVGGADTTLGLTLTCQDNDGDVITQAPPVLDPYKDVPWPENVSPCNQPTPDETGKKIYDPGGSTNAVSCDLTNLSGTIHFNPGRYVIPNGASFSAQAGTKITGDDVTFFFEGSAKLDIAGHADLILSAPDDPTDPYAGILFYGNRTASAVGIQHKMLGSSGSALTGAIYMPLSEVVYQGNSTISGTCLQIVADKVTMTGNTEMSLGSSCAAAGTKPLLTGQIVKLVE